MNWSDLLFDKRHVFLLNEISSVLQRIIDCTSAIKCPHKTVRSDRTWMEFLMLGRRLARFIEDWQDDKNQKLSLSSISLVSQVMAVYHLIRQVNAFTGSWNTRSKISIRLLVNWVKLKFCVQWMQMFKEKMWRTYWTVSMNEKHE